MQRRSVTIKSRRRISRRHMWCWYMIFYILMLAVVIGASIYLGLNFDGRGRQSNSSQNPTPSATGDSSELRGIPPILRPQPPGDAHGKLNITADLEHLVSNFSTNVEDQRLSQLKVSDEITNGSKAPETSAGSGAAQEVRQETKSKTPEEQQSKTDEVAPSKVPVASSREQVPGAGNGEEPKALNRRLTRAPVPASNSETATPDVKERQSAMVPSKMENRMLKTSFNDFADAIVEFNHQKSSFTLKDGADSTAEIPGINSPAIISSSVTSSCVPELLEDKKNVKTEEEDDKNGRNLNGVSHSPELIQSSVLTFRADDLKSHTDKIGDKITYETFIDSSSLPSNDVSLEEAWIDSSEIPKSHVTLNDSNLISNWEMSRKVVQIDSTMTSNLESSTGVTQIEGNWTPAYSGGNVEASVRADMTGTDSKVELDDSKSSNLVTASTSRVNSTDWTLLLNSRMSQDEIPFDSTLDPNFGSSSRFTQIYAKPTPPYSRYLEGSTSLETMGNNSRAQLDDLDTSKFVQVMSDINQQSVSMTQVHPNDSKLTSKSEMSHTGLRLGCTTTSRVSSSSRLSQVDEALTQRYLTSRGVARMDSKNVQLGSVTIPPKTPQTDENVYRGFSQSSDSPMHPESTWNDSAMKAKPLEDLATVNLKSDIHQDRVPITPVNLNDSSPILDSRKNEAAVPPDFRTGAALKSTSGVSPGRENLNRKYTDRSSDDSSQSSLADRSGSSGATIQVQSVRGSIITALKSFPNTDHIYPEIITATGQTYSESVSGVVSRLLSTTSGADFRRTDPVVNSSTP